MNMNMQPQYSGQSALPLSVNPEQMMAQTQIAPAVFQVAEAAGLGVPTREYNRGAKSSNAMGLVIAIPLSIALLTVLIVPVGITFASPLPLDFPLNLFPLIFPLVFIPILGPILFKAWKGVFGGGKVGAFRAWSCPDGLVYEQNGRLQAARWVDIAQVWRKVGFVNGVPMAVSYVVQSSHGESFSFSLLSGPLAGLASSFGPGTSVSISGVGSISSSGDMLQITGNVDLAAYAGLGDLIEDQMVQRQMPLALDAYRRGSPILFGRLTIQRQGMSDGVKTLSWDEFEHAMGNTALLQITKKPAGLPWFTLSATNTPNMALLVALLKAIRSDQG